MIRKLIAIVLGLAVAIVLVSLIQKFGHSLYPPPPDLDLNDQDFMRDYIAGLPWGPLAFVLGSYVAATFAGGLLAALIVRERTLIIAGVIGLFVLAGAIANMVVIPHPSWFAATAVAGIILAVILAAKLAAGGSVRAKVY